MQTKTGMSAVVMLGLVSAVAGAYSVTAIYREGNLLAWGLALFLPLAALSIIYRDFGKRICALLTATLLVSAVTWLWLTLGDDFGSSALLSLVLLGLLIPVGLDLMLLDNGRRLA